MRYANLTHDQQIAADMAAIKARVMPGKPVVPPSCFECGRFTPSSINPGVGLGMCGKGHGSCYAGQRPQCVDHQPIKDRNGHLRTQ